jgi:hypothetical protein
MASPVFVTAPVVGAVVSTHLPVSAALQADAWPPRALRFGTIESGQREY